MKKTMMPLIQHCVIKQEKTKSRNYFKKANLLVFVDNMIVGLPSKI